MLYKELAGIYEQLESTTLKSGKTEILAQLFEKTKPEELPATVLLSMGRVYPEWSEKETGVASKLMMRAISQAYGTPLKKVEDEWKKKGDLGKVAEEFSRNKKQETLFSKTLTTGMVFRNIKKIAELSGPKSQERKLSLVAELLSFSQGKESRYITRTILEDIRIGVAEGITRDAISKAFFADVLWEDLLLHKKDSMKRHELLAEALSGKSIIIEDALAEKIPGLEKSLEKNNSVAVKTRDQLEKIRSFWKKSLKTDIILVKDASFGSSLKKRILETVEHAYEIANDYGLVAKIAAEGGEKELEKLGLEPLRPAKGMLYQKVESLEDGFKAVGTPCALEYKYDGFRLQCHRKGGVIKLYTRRLDDVTKQFPDVAEALKKNVMAQEFILDSEVIGIDPKTRKWLPFQKISRRIRRKYDVHEMLKKIPVMINVFDIMYLDGRTLLKAPFEERRAFLEKIIRTVPEKIRPAVQFITSDVEEARKFYNESLEKGNEGIMAKNLQAVYKPGSRVGYGVKIKPTMETLDLVIVGADWGTGKRVAWLSSFILACRDEATGEFLEIGKMGTGIKEKKEEGVSFEELTELLSPLILKEKGKEVRLKPKYVVEVAYEELQKSPTYSSGYALRFPRLVRLREDRSPDEIDTLDTVSRLYNNQRGRK